MFKRDKQRYQTSQQSKSAVRKEKSYKHDHCEDLFFRQAEKNYGQKCFISLRKKFIGKLKSAQPTFCSTERSTFFLRSDQVTDSRKLGKISIS